MTQKPATSSVVHRLESDPDRDTRCTSSHSMQFITLCPAHLNDIGLLSVYVETVEMLNEACTDSPNFILCENLCIFASFGGLCTTVTWIVLLTCWSLKWNTLMVIILIIVSALVSLALVTWTYRFRERRNRLIEERICAVLCFSNEILSRMYRPNRVGELLPYRWGQYHQGFGFNREDFIVLVDLTKVSIPMILPT